MTEPFDAELSRTIKESTEQELEGWEFSPAMQSSVLDRIRAEESGAAPAGRPSRRLDPSRLIRPAAWTAVAAAAVLIAVRMDLGGMGGAATKSAPSAPSVAQGQTPAPAAKQTAPKTAEQAPSSGTAADKATAANGQQTASNDGGQSSAPVQAPAPAGEQPAAEQPGQRALAPAQPTTSGPKALAVPATQPDAGSTVALDLPPADKAKQASPPVMGIMARTSEKVALTATAAGRAVELSQTGVREFQPDGVELWSRPVEGVTGESLLAASDDGSIAVTVAGQVDVLAADGEPVAMLKAGAPVTGIAWSRDGRLAVAADSAVTIFNAADGKPMFRIEGFTRPDLAFALDGALAVYGGGTAGRRVALYSRDGAALMEAEQAGTAGGGVAFTPGGVLAGPMAYDRQGGTLWKAPITPEGITELPGTGLLLTWNRGDVVSVRAQDGAPAWKAVWGRPGDGIRQVVASPDGRFVAVIAAADEGWAVWVLDRNGKVLLSERLSEQPAGVAFVGDKLVLLMGGSVQFRPLQQ